LKNRKEINQAGRELQGRRLIWSLILLAVILIILVAAFWVIRPLLLASLPAEEQTSTGDQQTISTVTAGVTPTETAASAGERPAGELAALPAAAFENGSTITVGVSDAFGQINPLYAGGDADQDAVALIFEPLLRIDSKGELEYILAASIEPDLPARKLKLKLKPDHTWRDGSVVNAADVVFTYNCLLSPSYDGPLAGRFTDIIAVEAVDAADNAAIVMTFATDITDFDYSLLTVGILKHDYYEVPTDRVYEMGRRKQTPEGSGPYEWLADGNGKRLLGLREGYAGEIKKIEQLHVAADEKYPLLEAGALDIVRHDWNERIKSRIGRLPAYAYYDSLRADQYLLITPEPAQNGLSDDREYLAALLATASGQKIMPTQITDSAETAATDQTMFAAGKGDTAPAVKLAYFEGIEDTVSKQQAANAALIKRRLEAGGYSVELQPVSWPELANRASLGTYQLLLLPAATDNRLPRGINLKSNRDSQFVNAAIAFEQPEIILVSSRLSGLTFNRNGMPFSTSPLTFTDHLADVRLLDAAGNHLIN
jgi:hypothetical protein